MAKLNLKLCRVDQVELYALLIDIFLKKTLTNAICQLHLVMSENYWQSP